MYKVASFTIENKELKMSNKSIFVFGLLLTSAWTQDLSEDQILEPEDVESIVSASEDNKLKLSDVLCENVNERKEVNEDIKNAQKDISQSG